jgi:hypothetical protein
MVVERKEIKMKKIYEIKENGKWEKVLANSIHDVFAYDKKHNLQDYRASGMYSISETAKIYETARTI